MTFSTNMGPGMGGLHVFEATIDSNDMTAADNKVTIRVDYLE